MKKYYCIKCEKEIDNPLVTMTLTYPMSANKKIYQCPHCKGKLEVIKEEKEIERIQPS